MMIKKFVCLDATINEYLGVPTVAQLFTSGRKSLPLN